MIPKKELKIGVFVFPKLSMRFINKGHWIHFNNNDKLWITDKCRLNESEYLLKIGRRGKHKIGEGYFLHQDQVKQLFELER